MKTDDRLAAMTAEVELSRITIRRFLTGCDLERGHEPPCVCNPDDPDGLCSTYTPGVGVRFNVWDEAVDPTLSEPVPVMAFGEDAR